MNAVLASSFSAKYAVPLLLISVVLLFLGTLCYMEVSRRKRISPSRVALGNRHNSIIAQASNVYNVMQDTGQKISENSARMDREVQERKERIATLRFGVDVQERDSG